MENPKIAGCPPRAHPARRPARQPIAVFPLMNAPVDVSFFARAAKPLTSYRKYWAARFGTAKFLPTTRGEMDALGWDSCDIIVVTGDAYVDHPSFGMAVIGRVLEAQGFRVGIIAQPDWQSAEPFKALGKPNLFFGVTAGNMDSMINRYTADRKIRSDDAYTPGDVGGKRPDRAAIVYSQRCKEAWSDVPIVLGGIEGSLRLSWRAGARPRPPPARHCHRAGHRPWRRPGSSGAPCRTSSRNARCGAGCPRSRRARWGRP